MTKMSPCMSTFVPFLQLSYHFGKKNVRSFPLIPSHPSSSTISLPITHHFERWSGRCCPSLFSQDFERKALVRWDSWASSWNSSLFILNVKTIEKHRCTLLVLPWAPFYLQNCFNSSRHRFKRCWKNSPDILVHIDKTASHAVGALLNWDLVAVEAIGVQWTHCHVQLISLR